MLAALEAVAQESLELLSIQADTLIASCDSRILSLRFAHLNLCLGTSLFLRPFYIVIDQLTFVHP